MAKDIVYSAKNLNSPNVISLIRLVILPPLFIWLVANNWYDKAFLVFLAGWLSDVIDGLIARNYDKITRVGELLDPWADKVFFITSTVFILLGFPPRLSSIPTNIHLPGGILLGLEAGLLLLGLVGLLYLLWKKKKDIKLGASVFGKIKMSAEMIFVLSLFIEKLGWMETADFLPPILWIAVIAAALSIVKHFLSLPKLFRSA